jgi:hypothetical protein
MTIATANPELLSIAMNFYFPLLLSQIYNQRFIFMVQLLSIYLGYLHLTLEKSINYQPILVRKEDYRGWKARVNHTKVKVVQECYHLLWEASSLINESFDISLIAFFIVSFLSLLYQGYSLCVEITKRRHNHLRELLSIFMTCHGIFSIHSHCQQTSRNVISYQ